MLKHLKKLVGLMKEHDLTAVAVNPGSSLTYLTGYHFHLMERPIVLLVAVTGDAVIILPELEQGKVSDDLQVVPFADDPATWQDAFAQAQKLLDISVGKIGVEPTVLRFLELRYLQTAFDSADFVDASQLFGALRLQKTTDEVAKMRQAARIAQDALTAALNGIRPGMSEREIANELVVQLLRKGSTPTLPFQPIVALGENSANPHAVPTDRKLTDGDLLLIDWGASYQDYFSDITRTFTFGAVDPELLKIGEIVQQANQAGRSAGKPGIDAGAVDSAARAVITQAGYGEAFFHRTGHGLGMEAHEAPYIYAGNNLLLAEGMTFTVEPGIYLAGRGGVRIEDDVVVTESGLESLTDLPRQLLPLEQFLGR